MEYVLNEYSLELRVSSGLSEPYPSPFLLSIFLYFTSTFDPMVFPCYYYLKFSPIFYQCIPAIIVLLSLLLW